MTVQPVSQRPITQEERDAAIMQARLRAIAQQQQAQRAAQQQGGGVNLGTAIQGAALANKAGLFGSGGGQAAQAASGATPVGTAANGGTMMSDGSVVAGNAASGGTPGFSIGSPSYAGYLSGAFEGVNMIDNLHRVPAEDRATYLQGHTALAVGDVYTGGLASAAYNAIGQTGIGQKAIGGLHKLDKKVNPLTIGLNKSGIFHKSTKDYERERWAKVAKDGAPGAETAYLANHPEGDDSIWKDGPFKGKKWNFADAKTLAKENPDTFMLVLGNYELAPNWDSIPMDKRREIVKQMVAADLYTPSKGDVRISDKAAGQKIIDGVMASSTPGQPAPASQPAPAKPVEPNSTFGTKTPPISAVPRPAAGQFPAQSVAGGQQSLARQQLAPRRATTTNHFDNALDKILSQGKKR